MTQRSSVYVLYLPVLVLALALPALAQTTSDPVAAVDNLAPEPVSDVVAEATPDGVVEVSWFLSPSDGQRPAATGDVTSGGTFVPVNDVAAYNIYRSENSGDFVLAGSAEPGATLFADNSAVSGATLIYQVTAIDAAGNESAAVESETVSLGPPPALAIDSASDVDFGEVENDAVVTHVITITNEETLENANLSLTASVGLGTEGVSDAGFSVEPASLLLAPGESGELSVTFSATDAGGFNGDYEAELTLLTNDPDLIDSEVAIGFFAAIIGGIATPEIQVSTFEFNFGQRKIGTTGTRLLTISNLGGLPLQGSVTVDGAGFAVEDGVINLGADESQEVTLTFTPDLEADFTGTATVSSNDVDEGEIDIALSGTGVTEVSGPGTQVRQVAKATLRVGDTIDTEDSVAVDAFLEQLFALLEQLLGIDRSRVRIISLEQGSTIVNFQILEAAEGSTEPTPEEAIVELATVVADTTSDEFVDLGGTESFVDTSEEVVLAPVDGNGEPILGWFSFGTADTQVGFDDFFLFADNFGLSDTDAGFDPIFDIAPADAPDGAIGFDDFFRFADDFGKQVANAEEIIAVLP